MNFKQLNLIPPLQRAVADAGYKSPSPIQEKAIPPVLAGRDLLACAQTGTGKTAAFALPILQLLAAREPTGKRGTRALVMTPTRELALQIQESFETYGKYLKLKSTVIFGGVGQQPQVDALRRGVDILVATPGRLNDLIGQGHIKLGSLEVFVLDEADRMLDMGFVNDVKKVIRHLPEKRQTLLFSATMPDEIISLANTLLQKPTKVFVTPVSSTVESIGQTIYKIDKANKRKLLAHLLRAENAPSALVFTRTKHGADRVARDLCRNGIKAVAIHGNKSQGARQDALAKFKKGDAQVMVATDIAARGLDINELSHVFNYDLPNVPETYVHRIGRTGRAGHGGTAISFAQFDELEYLADIEKLIGFKIEEVKDHPWPMQVFEAPPKGAQQNAGRGAKAPAQEKKTEQNKPKQPAAKRNPQAKPQPKKPAAAPTGKNTPKAPPKKAATGVPTNGTGPRGNNRAGTRRGPAPFDPYDNLTGGKAIVTKSPVWSVPVDDRRKEAPASEGDDSMSRNSNRRRGGKNRGKKNTPSIPPKPKAPEIPKNEKGVFDFSEAELAEDEGLQVISRRESDEVKYQNFEEYLKDR